MNANATAQVTAPRRPPVIDYAVYALIARCVFSLLSALALYGARSEVTTSLADANKSKHWSAATLHHNVDTVLRGNLISTVVMIVLVAILIKFIRDGRNWSRWVYLVFSVLITRDLFQVFGFFQYDNVAVRLTTGLVGLSAVAALVLLFLPESNAYFRPATGAAPPSLLGGLFRPRPNVRGTGPGAGPVEPATDAPVEPATDAPVEPATDAPVEPATDAPVVNAVEPGPAPDDTGAPAADGRPVPRGKSRQPGLPKRPGSAR